MLAPVEIPEAIPSSESGTVEGLGVEGGVAGGVPGGMGGLPEPVPAVPPASPPVRIAANVREAVPLVRVNPLYPEAAVRARLQGTVILDVLVSPEGKPIELRVIRPLPFLDQAAREAVKQWRWRAYLIDGQPVPFWVTVNVDFRINAARALE